ncbi:hypothetical protein GCM10009753_25360 [Streptantibioticus ferralitis]
MADSPERRDEHTGHLLPDEPPRLLFEVKILGGAEGERLRIEQTRVIREVMEWVIAQRRSELGQSNAA